MNSLKAIVSAVAAGLTVLVVQGGDVLPTWALLIAAALVAGLATWIAPPGPGLHTPPPAPRGQRRSDVGAISGDMVLSVAVGVFLGGLALWVLDLLVNRA